MKVIPYQIKRDSNIFLAGDRHIGSAARNENAWNKFVAMLDDEYSGCKNNYTVLHGDDIEAIASDDRRFSHLTNKDLPLAEAEKAVEEDKAISDKIIVKLLGNHCYKWFRFGDLAEWIAKQNNVEYGTNSCVIVYKDESNRFLFRHHAWHPMSGTIRSQAKDPDQEIGNILASLKMRLKGRVGNCLLQSAGHWHQLLVNRPKKQLLHVEREGKVVKEYASAKKRDGYIHPDYRWYVCTGSFLDFYVDGISTYVERSGSIKPADLGFAIVKVRDGKIENVDRIKLT